MQSMKVGILNIQLESCLPHRIREYSIVKEWDDHQAILYTMAGVAPLASDI